MIDRTSRGRLCGCVMVCLLLVGLASPAMCGVVSYSTAVADYEIKYDTVFGDPDPSAILFQPLDFNARSVAAVPPIDLTDGTMIVTVTPLVGKVLESITFFEGGDYTLSGAVGQTSQAYVSATLFVDCVTVEVDGSPVTTVNLDCMKQFEKNVTFTPGSTPDQGFWSLTCAIDVADALDAAGITGNVTKLRFSINNTLLASSQPASAAFIAKKHFGIDDIPVVPEPSTLVLLLAGGCLLLVRRK